MTKPEALYEIEQVANKLSISSSASNVQLAEKLFAALEAWSGPFVSLTEDKGCSPA